MKIPRNQLKRSSLIKMMRKMLLCMKWKKRKRLLNRSMQLLWKSTRKKMTRKNRKKSK
jgi:hypothetical protein